MHDILDNRLASACHCVGGRLLWQKIDLKGFKLENLNLKKLTNTKLTI